MATKKSTIEFLLDQFATISTIRARAMFGEYALYCDEKVVAFVCDDQLFVKPSSAQAPFEEYCELAPPYPGAKNYLRVGDDKLDDRDWLVDFIRATADALPLPKPKKGTS